VRAVWTGQYMHLTTYACEYMFCGYCGGQKDACSCNTAPRAGTASERRRPLSNDEKDAGCPGPSVPPQWESLSRLAEERLPPASRGMARFGHARITREMLKYFFFPVFLGLASSQDFLSLLESSRPGPRAQFLPLSLRCVTHNVRSQLRGEWAQK